MEGVSTLSALKEVVTYCYDLMGDVVTTIADKPLLLIPVAIFIGGSGIGLAKRLIHG